MAYSIFKVIGITNGKISAVPVYNNSEITLPTDGTLRKFIFVKSSDLEINTSENTLTNIKFNYKDKL